MLRYTIIGKIQNILMYSASIMAGPIIYQAGGYNDINCGGISDEPVSTVSSIDVTIRKDHFKHCGDLPEPLSHHAMIYAKQHLYVIGGKRKDGSISSTIWSTNLDFTRRDLFDAKWIEVGKLPNGVFGHSAINIDGEIYIMGGITDKKYCKGMKQIFKLIFNGKHAEGYDVIGYLPGHLYIPEVKFFKRKLIIIGGTIAGTNTPNTTVYGIDVMGDVLSKAYPVGYTLSHVGYPTVFVLNNRLYYSGGITHDKSTNLPTGFHKGVYELILGASADTTVSEYQGVVPAGLFTFDHVVGRERSFILGGRNETGFCHDVIAVSS